MRFTVLSDEGERIGAIAFEAGRLDADDLPNTALAEVLEERYRELRTEGGYDDRDRLVRATLERVSADTGMRFVRDPDE